MDYERVLASRTAARLGLPGFDHARLVAEIDRILAQQTTLATDGAAR